MQITTTAPISLENLKKYYADKSTSYLIDYKNSTLKGQKLLVYLSNLDLDCDILIEEMNEEFFSLLKDYFNSTSLVKVRFLELCAIDVLKENKGLIKDDSRYKQFITDNKYIIDEWSKKLDSLIVFNTYVIKDELAQTEALSFPLDENDSIEGINWVSLVKNVEFYDFYAKVDTANLTFYKNYFNNYMFKGKNLFAFWANENNPLYLLAWGMMTGEVTPENFKEVIESSHQELKNVEVS
jgi:hypothetical protein